MGTSGCLKVVCSPGLWTNDCRSGEVPTRSRNRSPVTRSFKNFGRLVAVDNIVNGLFGLLQFALTYFAIHSLNGNFTWINVGQVVVLTPLTWFCYKMYIWERQDLVAIRAMEGEELPCDMLGSRERKKINIKMPDLPHVELPTFGRRSSVEDGTRTGLT